MQRHGVAKEHKVGANNKSKLSMWLYLPRCFRRYEKRNNRADEVSALLRSVWGSEHKPLP